MSRILIYEPRQSCDECQKFLSNQGHEVVLCAEREALIDSLAERKADVLVYVLNELNVDLAVLSLLRRVSPTLPLIVLGGPAGLEARRSVQELRPTYYGLFPLDPSELSDAVRGALDHRGGRALAS